MKTEFSITKPNFITKYYFDLIYKNIIKIGKFDENKAILDYGCGYGYLKKWNLKIGNNSKIINYDIIEELSEIKNIFDVEFEKIVFCQSLYLIHKIEIIELLRKLKNKQPNLTIIAVISKQSLLNKFLSIILFHWKFYDSVKTKPQIEEKILRENCTVEEEHDFILSKLIKLKFK